MNYWEVAAGSSGRDYTNEFITYGIAFAGENHVTMINGPKPGDCVVLKKGVTKIAAAGIVVEREGRFNGNAREQAGKEWLMDYDGWRLPLYFFVDWHKPMEPKKVDGLKMGTINRIHQGEPKKVAEEIIANTPIYPISPEPGPVEDLTYDKMLLHLISLGLEKSNANDFITTINHICDLARYYYTTCRWSDVREHELRTFLIIPFLLAVGWSEKQLKIELGVSGQRIDIACFKHEYNRKNKERKPNNYDCVIILESKGFTKGLDYVHKQANIYASYFPNCNVIVTSNGYCYKAYKRQEGKKDFEHKPIAYLNLISPKNKYPRDPAVEGGLKLLEYIIPQTWITSGDV